MKNIAKLLILLLFIVLMALQSNHFFELGGTNPNLLLIGFLILSLSLSRKEGLKFLLFIGIGLILVSLIWFPFWVWGIILVFLFSLILFFFKNLLSGISFIDFFISIFLFTILFYLVFWVIGLGVFLWPVIIAEILYNLILGEIVLLAIKK